MRSSSSARWRSSALAKLVPGARLEVLAGAGHIPQIESPRRFNEALVRFLVGLPAK